MDGLFLSCLMVIIVLCVVIIAIVSRREKAKTSTDELEITDVDRETFGLKPPWYVLRFEIAKFFESDEDIEVSPMIEQRPNGNYTLFITVHSVKKYEAMVALMRDSYDLSGVTLHIDIECDVNGATTPVMPEVSIELIDTLLSGNPYYHETVKKMLPWPWNREVLFVVMKKEIVQYPADDISDLWGKENKTAEDVLVDLLKPNFANVNICTLYEEN